MCVARALGGQEIMKRYKWRVERDRSRRELCQQVTHATTCYPFIPCLKIMSSDSMNQSGCLLLAFQQRPPLLTRLDHFQNELRTHTLMICVTLSTPLHCCMHLHKASYPFASSWCNQWQDQLLDLGWCQVAKRMLLFWYQVLQDRRWKS